MGSGVGAMCGWKPGHHRDPDGIVTEEQRTGGRLTLLRTGSAVSTISSLTCLTP